MIACRSNMCFPWTCRRNHAGTAARSSRGTYRSPSPTLATRIVCFSEKRPFIHAGGRAVVKRECLELGGQRNWLLTRPSPTSMRLLEGPYTQSQWQKAPRAFAAAGCKTTGAAWTIRYGGEKLRLTQRRIPALTTMLQARGRVHAAGRVRQLGERRESNGQFRR